MTTAAEVNVVIDGSGFTADADDVDVVIVGSGFAGLAAAIEAAADPANSVVVVEKMGELGGNSIWNGGQVAAVGSPEQAAAGIADSPELMEKDMLDAGGNLNHIDLLRILSHGSNETADWTRSLGVEYRPKLSHLGGHSVPRTLCTLGSVGHDLITPMLAKIHSLKNVKMLINTTIVGLVTDPLGRVLGVETRPSCDPDVGAEIPTPGRIRCRKGVVLAAGGFGADVAFRAVQDPRFGAEVMTTNQPGATAEMLRATLRIGAMPVQLSHIQLGPWTSPDEGRFGRVPLFCLGAGFPHGILVNPATGARFVNEMANRRVRSHAILGLGQPAVCLTDAAGAQHSLVHPLGMLAPALQEHQTIAALAAAHGMDASKLEHTIAEYNRGVEGGSDAFGKPLSAETKPIARAPFYCARIWPKVHHTCGGVQINPRAMVLDLDGAPIPRLFAAGEFVGGVHGADRLGSCATTECLLFGRIAGKQAAAQERSP